MHGATETTVRRVLVLGGAGYIGTALVHELVCCTSFSIDIIDNFVTSTVDHIGPVLKCPQAKGRIRIFEGNHADSQFLRRVIQEDQTPIIGVFVLSGLSVVHDSVHNPLLYYENNMIGFLRILQVVCEQECIPHLIFSSSATANEYKSNSSSVSPYGKIKSFCEEMLADCAVAHKIRYVTLRYFNVSGAHPEGLYGERHFPETHLIPRAVMSALRSTMIPFQIFGTDYETADGTCMRDYVHVLDVAQANIRALKYLEEGGVSATLNVGSGCGSSVRQVLQAVMNITNAQLQLNELGRREGDAAIAIADIRRTRELLGWDPRNSNLEYIIQTVVDFCKEHSLF